MKRIFSLLLPLTFALAACQSDSDVARHALVAEVESLCPAGEMPIDGVGCVGRDPNDASCARFGSLDDFTSTACTHYTVCGDDIRKLRCNGGSCTCNTNGVESSPFPQGNTCDAAETAMLTSIDKCAAPAL